MMVWLSGVVFVGCCQAANAAPSMEFCPMAVKSHHCDKAQDEPVRDSLSRRIPACADCCAFLPVMFDKARKIEPLQQVSVARVVELEPARFKPVAVRTTSVRSTYRARSPDKQATFIINRVFRI